MSFTTTDDISIASYLVVKGFPIRGTEKQGRFIHFQFDPEAKTIIRQWQLTPTKEQQLIISFVGERERLFRVIKQHRNMDGGEYGNQR